MRASLWIESENGLMVNPDPVLGGIIDKTIKTGEWFVIFHSDLIPTIEGLESKEKALQAFNDALESVYQLS